MKKVWTYISAALAGMIAGIIIAVKWLNEPGTVVTVKKIKNKRSSGDMSVVVPIKVESPKYARKQAKEAKKQARLEERNEKKKLKAEKVK